MDNPAFVFARNVLNATNISCDDDDDAKGIWQAKMLG
jgi:hypothetical protein